MLRNFIYISALLALTQNVFARDYIRISGSSTVYPFTTMVVDRFTMSNNGKFRAPVVTSNGTGGGFKLFCSGIGYDYPDLNDASRPIKDSEKKFCKKNGIDDIIEVKIGYDAIILITPKSMKLDLGVEDIFRALAVKIPDADGNLIDNPYKTWRDVNSKLPNVPIKVLGPSPTSGTRDSFLELAMERGALKNPFLVKLKSSDKNAFLRVAHSLRPDAWVDGGENDVLLVKKVELSKNLIGIVGYSYYKEYKNMLLAVSIDGADPAKSLDNYKLSRPLFVYVKGEHVNVISGIKEFLTELVDSGTIGSKGYLVKEGLIPISSKEFFDLRKELIAIGAIN